MKYERKRLSYFLLRLSSVHGELPDPPQELCHVSGVREEVMELQSETMRGERSGGHAVFDCYFGIA